MKTTTKRIRVKRYKGDDWAWSWVLVGLVYVIIWPFDKLWKGLKWVGIKLFFETKQTEWNGVFGPGGRTYSYHEFSWGKTAFVIALISLILIIIYII
jgi:hypothetical protein